MSHGTSTRRRPWSERALSLLLAAVIAAGLLPASTLPASAHWADPYLDQLVDWGVMRADQTTNPDAPLTRAEFMGIINRAYGYTEKGEIPFTDVSTTDWFYDDVSIAYTAGYMAGTSETTASPNSTLTREQAVCILGRNMMLKETPGESLAFADSRDVSDWARGTVKTAVDNYIVSGYTDNTFHPRDPVSKGQMAVLITQCIGNPVQQSGSYELGGVFGNVTITSPNVTLRNTTISGDLYVSGGVGLGGIKLENVNVLGRIIVSGTGESESGDASIVMRNVTAQEMLVDNMRNKTVTVRADGITDIAKTVVRTDAYLEDNNTDDKGLMRIELDGEPDENLKLTLAGRIKEVVNKTPNSTIQVAKGTVAKLTVDEAATNSFVQLDRNTVVKEMNLDVASTVTGEGDIEKLNVNAPGCNVAMLPEKIYIRPGLTAVIDGVVMDHLAAEEGSTDPRLLSGYPAAKDIAPTGFRAEFSGNKKGTVYWAVSDITDGSIEEEDLISPPSYGSKAVQGGRVSAPTGDTVVNAQVGGLAVGTSYYLSAILVDDQGNRSPVKVVSFTTPDNTVPAFAQGYPYMSMVGKEYEEDERLMAQVTVMATKDCLMYYAVLPAGAAVPTVNDMKSANVKGNLGFGIVDLYKNQEMPFTVSRQLEELKDYVLYMWLTDADGANSSAVISLPFRTPDVTPPVFLIKPYVNEQVQANSVQMGSTIDEDGTIYWVAVPAGTPYPKPNNQRPEDNETIGEGENAASVAKLTSEFAKLQVQKGMNCKPGGSNGSVRAVANIEANMNVTGLQPATAYDLYYVAVDAAGNSTQVYKLEGGIHTQDTSGPVVSQKFTNFSGLDETKDPMNDTDIILEFSENICSTAVPGKDLLSLYQTTRDNPNDIAALEEFVRALRSSFTLYEQITGTRETPVNVREYGILSNGDYGPTSHLDDWVVDYTKVQVKSLEGGKIQVVFPGVKNNPTDPGLQLNSGSTYFFKITNLTDNSDAKNPIDPRTVQDDEASTKAGHNVPRFTVVFARLFMTQIDIDTKQWPDKVQAEQPPVTNPNDTTKYQYNVDFSFRVIPDATSTVSSSMAYDLLLWTDSTIQYDLYYRVVKTTGDKGQVTDSAWTDKNGKHEYNMTTVGAQKRQTPDTSGWVLLGDSKEILTNGRELFGKSLHVNFNGCNVGNFPPVNDLDDTGNVYYEFAVCIRKMGTGTTSTNPDTWSGTVNYYVDAVASTSGNLYRLGSNNLSESKLADFENQGLGGGGGVTIGSTDNRENPKRLHMATPFTDSTQPQYAQHFPQFEAESTTVDMSLTLNRPGTVYYAIAPADNTGRELADPNTWVPTIDTQVKDASVAGGQRTIKHTEVPKNGDDPLPDPDLVTPEKGNIFRPDEWAEATKAITGTVEYKGVVTKPETVTGLEPNRTYYVYTVIVGSANEPSKVEIFKFKTNPTPRPLMELNPVNNNTQKGVNMTTTNMNSYISYVVYPKTELDKFYRMLTGNAASGTQSNLLSDIVKDEYKNKIPTAYANWNILQALTNKYYFSVASNGNKVTDAYFPADGKNDYTAFDGYSVFDIYVSANAKENFRSWFAGSGNVPVEIQYTGTSQPATAQTAVDTPIRQNAFTLGGDRAHPGAQYYMLAVARSQDSKVTDSADLTCSFLATPYQISDLDPPILTLASGNFTKGSNASIQSGSLTLIFDKPVYVKNTGLDADKLTKDNFFTNGNKSTLGDPDSVSSTGTNTVVTFDLTKATGTFSATVAGGAFYNVGGVPATQTLSIDLVPYEVDLGVTGGKVTRYRIVVKWGNLGEWTIEDSLNP